MRDIQRGQPSPGYRRLLRLLWCAAAAAAAGLTAFFHHFFGLPAALLMLSVTGGCVWGIVFMPQLSCERYRFVCERDRIRIERGVLVRRRTLVPRERLQYVEATVTPIHRIFGIATVTLVTASSRVNLHGIALCDVDLFRDDATPPSRKPSADRRRTAKR